MANSWFRHLLGNNDDGEELKDDGTSMDELVQQTVDALNQARNRAILEGDPEAVDDLRRELTDQNPEELPPESPPPPSPPPSPRR